ncbi:MAG: hypothetical protein HY660_08500, partial [Armatimonadetes bacterium]|nr:hypothetical protein [Armatimonadota bacterium]
MEKGPRVPERRARAGVAALAGSGMRRVTPAGDAVIQASAPTRIDLAGGTLDIYPLYLFEGEGLTVNIAIDLMTS